MRHFGKQIDQLVLLGYPSNYREWSLGKTIAVCDPKTAFTADGEVLYEDMMYLRFERGKWLVTEMSIARAEPHAVLETWEDVLAYIEQRFALGVPAS